MYRYFILLFIFLLNVNLSAQDTIALHFAKSISKDNLQQDIIMLASDEMEGRETGTIGQKNAAKYIYEQFKQSQIQNKTENLDSTGYFQNFSVYQQKNSIAEIITDGKTLKTKEDILITGYTNFKNDSLDLIFIGTAPDSSFMEQDFSNKAVLFLTTNLYAGAIKSNDIVKFSDAKVVLFCNPVESEQFEDLVEKGKKASNNRLQLKGNANSYRNPYDSIKSKNAYNRYKTKMESYKGAVSPSAASNILNIKIRDLRNLFLKGKGNYSNHPMQKIAFDFHLPYKEIPTENVVAFLPGTSKKDEFIAITAHYDHVGKNGDKIYNGANDNASGTSALIEIARKFQKAKEMGYSTSRSIIFIAFTGEEKGLLGSRYFVDNSLIPIDKVVANLNIDMLGRIDRAHKKANYIYLIGTNHLNPKLKTISDSINNISSKLDLDYSYDSPNNFLYKASDQASFVMKNVPAIFYFNGMHKDYHMPSDTAEKLDYQSIKKVCELIFLTAWELAI